MSTRKNIAIEVANAAWVPKDIPSVSFILNTIFLVYSNIEANLVRKLQSYRNDMVNNCLENSSMMHSFVLIILNYQTIGLVFRLIEKWSRL